MSRSPAVLGAPALALVGALALTLAVSGCSQASDDDGEGATRTTAATITAVPPLEDDSRLLIIDEVAFGSAGHVRLTNFTEADASLEGLFVCAPPKCVELPDSAVAGGESVRVAVGDGDDLEDVVVADAEFELDPESGEVGLYASDNPEEAEEVRAYVEWGSTPHAGTSAAVEAGVWIEGSYLNSAAEATRVFLSSNQQWDWE